MSKLTESERNKLPDNTFAGTNHSYQEMDKHQPKDLKIKSSHEFKARIIHNQEEINRNHINLSGNIKKIGRVIINYERDDYSIGE